MVNENRSQFTTRTLLVRFPIVFFGLAALGCIPITFNLNAQEPSKTQVFDFTLFGQRDVEIAAFELTDVTSGMEKKATIFFQNRCDQEIEFVKVQTGCKCTQATVPNIVLASGKSAQLDFQFSVPTAPSSLNETYDVVLHTKGAREFIKMRFDAKLQETVSFGRNDFIFRFSGNTKQPTFAIPLLVSRSDLVRELKVETDDDLLFTTVKLIAEKPSLQVSFFSDSIVTNAASGEIRLTRRGKTVANILCTLEKQKDFEIVPSPVTFIPRADAADEREGVAFIRLRKTDNKGYRVIRSVEIVGSTETKPTVTIIKVTDEMYRIKIAIENPTTFDTKDGIVFRVTTNDGETFEVKQKCMFSN